MQRKCFSVFGIVIESEIDLQLPETNHTPDVQIRLGKVPQTLENPRTNRFFFQSTETQFLLNIPHVGRFLVTEGHTITAELSKDVDEHLLRLTVLDSPLAFLLHQRGVLVLHASAIRAKHGAVVFCGLSAVGKSATAAALMRRGYSVLADDLCAVTFEDDGTPIVLPGLPYVQVWTPTLRRLNVEVDMANLVREGIGKFKMQDDAYQDDSQPLYRLYFLQTHNDPAKEAPCVNHITGIDKIARLMANIFHKSIFENTSGQNQIVQQCLSLTTQIPFYAAQRRIQPFKIKQFADMMQASIENTENGEVEESMSSIVVPDP